LLLETPWSSNARRAARNSGRAAVRRALVALSERL
jgi:hypothetical protein